MPWTEITRKQYRRDALRYASDMTDAEWALVKRLLPRANRRGRPRKTICGALWRRFFIFFRRAVSGGRCRGSPALLYSAGVLLWMAGYGPVAKDRLRSGVAGSQEARTHAKSDGGGDRQPKCAD